jgi:hypothetical protein
MTSPEERWAKERDRQVERDRKVISLILGSFTASLTFPLLVAVLAPELLGLVGYPALTFFAGYGLGGMKTWATLFPLEDELDDLDGPEEP